MPRITLKFKVPSNSTLKSAFSSIKLSENSSVLVTGCKLVTFIISESNHIQQNSFQDDRNIFKTFSRALSSLLCEMSALSRVCVTKSWNLFA